MELIKISNIKDEKIKIGEELFNQEKASYSEKRVEWMRKTIETLSTNDLRKSFTMEELFYLSVYDFWV